MADIYVNFSVSSVLTDDVIVNRTGGVTDTTQTAIDGNSNALITQSFASYAFPSGVVGLPSGLPDSGLFEPNLIHYGPPMQLNYNNNNNGNNARLIKNSTGSFSFNTNPNNYNEIHVALLSTQGSSNVRLTFNYTDGSTETSSVATVPDWYDEVTPNNDIYYLTDGLDRSKSDGTGYERAQDPALFGLRFVPNANKVLNSITVEKTTSSGYLSFFGATGVVSNRPPTDITLSPSTIAENQPIGTLIGTFSTTDPDGGNTFTYAGYYHISSGGKLTINGNQLKTNAVLDFETSPTLTIPIETVDQGGLYFVKHIVINVTNVNEAPTNIALSASSIGENSAIGTLIGNLITTDPDASNTFTYSIVSGIGDATAFSISGNQLKTKAAFNFESKSSYSVRVRTTDQGGLSVDKDLTIGVTNVNEAPTNITLSPSTIAENSAIGTLIGNLSTTDPDAGNTFTYSIVSGVGDATAFSISGNQLQTRAVLDFDTKPSYSVRVRTTDQGGLTVDKDLTIGVTNVNETPTNITLSASSIAENSAIGTLIGNLSTTDPDAGNTFTYSIVPGVGNGAAFTLSGNQLKANEIFDFETKSSFSLRVRSTDQGGLFVDKDLTINVTDVVENLTPTNITLSASTIAENQAIGTVIGNLSTTDPNAGDTFTYSIVTGVGDGDAFSISGNQLIAKESFDYETKPSYSLRVRTTDQGGLSYEKLLTIGVTNQNESPTNITLSASSIFEEEPVGTVIGNLSTTDPDVGNTFTYSIVSGFGDASDFTISGNKLVAKTIFDYESKSSYTVKVRSTDSGGLYTDSNFTITVINTNNSGELVSYIESLGYVLPQVLKDLLTSQLNNSGIPITVEEISAAKLVLEYNGAIEVSKILSSFTSLNSIAQQAGIGQHLPTITNPLLTINNFQDDNPSYGLRIPTLTTTALQGLMTELGLSGVVSGATFDLSLSESDVTVAYIGDLSLSSLLQSIPGINTLATGLNLPNTLTVGEPSLTVTALNTANPKYQFSAASLPTADLIAWLNSQGLPEFAQTLLSSISNVDLDFGSDVFKITYNGVLNVTSVINKLVADLGLGSAISQVLSITNPSLLIRKVNNTYTYEVSLPQIPTGQIMGLLADITSIDLLSELGTLGKVDLVLSTNGIKVTYPDPLKFDFGTVATLDPSLSFLKEGIAGVVETLGGVGTIITIADASVGISKLLGKTNIDIDGLINGYALSLLKTPDQFKLIYDGTIDVAKLINRLGVQIGLSALPGSFSLQVGGFDINLTKVNGVEDFKFSVSKLPTADLFSLFDAFGLTLPSFATDLFAGLTGIDFSFGKDLLEVHIPQINISGLLNGLGFGLNIGNFSVDDLSFKIEWINNIPNYSLSIPSLPSVQIGNLLGSIGLPSFATDFIGQIGNFQFNIGTNFLKLTGLGDFNLTPLINGLGFGNLLTAPWNLTLPTLDIQLVNGIKTYTLNIPNLPTLPKFDGMPDFAFDFFKNLGNLGLKIGKVGLNNLLELNYQGSLDISGLINDLSLDLGLGSINTFFTVSNPTLRLSGLGVNQFFEIYIPEITPSNVFDLFAELGGITLPNDIRLKLLSLGTAGLSLSTKGITLNFANNFNLDLGEMFSFDGAIPFIDTAIDGLITGIFGTPNLTLATPKLGLFDSLQGIELGINGLLNAQKFGLTFGTNLRFQYQLPTDLDFGAFNLGIPILEDFKISTPELILSTGSFNFKHPTLGTLNLVKGLNLIGDINFAGLNNNFGDFISGTLGIDNLGVYLGFNPGGLFSLKGNIAGNIPLLDIEGFNANLSSLTLGLDMGVDLEPDFGFTGNISLEGYDPTQANEPTMLLAGGLSLEVESVTGFFSSQAATPWINPYGLAGTELRNIGIQLGATYAGTGIDNFGFIGDLKWGNLNLQAALLVDVNDPDKQGMQLTVNQPVSLVDLWQGPVIQFLFKQAATQTDLVGKALTFLDKLLDIDIQSVDSNNDGKVDPLFKYVPFTTKIAGQVIDKGFAINGKLTAWGAPATLLLNGDTTMANVAGTLKIGKIDLGFLKITGVSDPTLDVALKVTPTEQYFSGDGRLEIFGQTIASAGFQITATKVEVKNIQFNLANVTTLQVNSLSVHLSTQGGNGSGTVTLLGNTLTAVSFSFSKDQIILSNIQLNLPANILSLKIQSLYVKSTDTTISGQATATMFGQSLSSVNFTINSNGVTINQATLSLGNLVSVKLQDVFVSSQAQELKAKGNLTILGYQFTNANFKLDSTGLTVENTSLGISDLASIAIPSLKIPINSQELSGVGVVTLIGKSLGSVNFKLDKDYLTIVSATLGISDLVSVALSNFKIPKSNFNSQASGTGTVTLLGKSLANVNFTLFKGGLSINNTTLDVSSLASLEISYLQVSTSSTELKGNGTVKLLGRSLTKVDYKLDNTGMTFSGDFRVSDLASVTLSNFKVGLNSPSASGKGTVKFLTRSFTNVDFKLDSTGLTISKASLGVPDFASFDLTDIKVATNEVKATASGSFKLLGQSLANLSVKIDSNKVEATGNLNFGVIKLENATFSLDTYSLSKLSISGTTKIFDIPLSGAKISATKDAFNVNAYVDLGIFKIENATLKWSKSSQSVGVTGTGKLFGFTLADASFSAGTDGITITKAKIGFGDYVSLEINNVKVSKATTSVSGSGTLKINGTELTGGSFSASSSGFSLKGNLGVNIPYFGNIGLSLGVSVGSSISATVGAITPFGDIGLISLNLASFSSDNVISIVGNALWDLIGDIPGYLLDLITDGVKTLTNIGGMVVSAASDLMNTVINFFKDIFGSGQSDPVKFNGGSGNDSSNGNDNKDVLFGNGGNDTLHGRLEPDQLDGGNGNDLLMGGNGEDTMFGSDGNDDILGQNHNDKLFGWNGNDRINGDGDSNETFSGGNDTIEGGSGRDTLWGGYGADLLSGGGGEDLLLGQDNNDTLYGDTENDSIQGGSGADYLGGGTGNDSLSGQDLNDTLAGGDGNDILWGGSGSDYLVGGSGDDSLFGNYNDPNNLDLASDTLSGETGNDYLNGEQGVDSIDGGEGNDTLIGGSTVTNQNIVVSADILTGGAGADIFWFKSSDEGGGATILDTAKIDKITDFKAAEGDKIYVSRSGFGSDKSKFSFNYSTGVLSYNTTLLVQLNGVTNTSQFSIDSNLSIVDW